MHRKGVLEKGRHKSAEFHREDETSHAAITSAQAGKRADKEYAGVNVYHYNRQNRYECSVDPERMAHQIETAECVVGIRKPSKKTAVLVQ